MKEVGNRESSEVTERRQWDYRKRKWGNQAKAQKKETKRLAKKSRSRTIFPK